MNVFYNRRQKLIDSLGNNEGVLIFANPESHDYHFVQDNNFLYLTGLKIPNAILLIQKSNDKGFSRLFIERNIPERIVWDGKKMEKEEACEISKIEAISYLDEFEDSIAYPLTMLGKIFINLNGIKYGMPLNKQAMFIEQARKTNPNVFYTDVTPKMSPLRSIKDEWEVKQIQQAIDTTEAGIRRIYANAKVGMKEYELEAMLYHTMLSTGYRKWGFLPIVAAGNNATTLHYGKNNTTIAENELVLLDVGSSCENYSADISRTFPIAKTFTKRQKEVYSAVLDVQKNIIDLMVPGAKMADLNAKTVELITEKLKELGLIKEDSEYRKYYMHSVGHHLGLNTHDLGARDSVLEAGNVITCEPGIYIPEEGIGVRIEDDILVSNGKPINLSANIPKEIEELEEIRTKALSK